MNSKKSSEIKCLWRDASSFQVATPNRVAPISRLHTGSMELLADNNSEKNDEPNTDVQLLLDENLEACVPEKSEESHLKSKHAITLYKALGTHPTITSFDNLHTRLKSLKRRPNATEQQKYQEALTELRQLVEQKQKEITDSIRNYEEKFYKKNNMLPSAETEYIAMCKEMKYTKKLLRSWNKF